MKNIKLKIYRPCLGLLMIVLAGLISCKRQDDFLDVKRNLSDVTPTTLADFQAILDGNNVMNTAYPIVGLEGTDNVLIPDANLSSATINERNSYIWAKDIFQGQACSDWSNPYKIIEYANIVLDGLAKITVTGSNQIQYNQLKGAALFYRAIAFYGLAQLFCPPYTASSAGSDAGIPLRLSSDINIPSTRASVQQTYDQIIADLQTAIPLLPVTPAYTTRPSLVSANALLAKVYLCMENYTNAGQYANNALNLNSTLLDYNSSLVSATSTYHFPTYTTGNPEVIFFATAIGYLTIEPNYNANVDTALYSAYSTNDLRKSYYFVNKGAGKIYFYGGYTGGLTNFAGIANDEIYLIRAECYARAGNLTAAMSDLNALLSKRWKTGSFVPLTATSQLDALTQILRERRKELPFAPLIRWEDLRRLNKDSRFSTIITHSYSGTTYTLPPNDKRYVYPIPDLEVQLYGLTQNIR